MRREGELPAKIGVGSEEKIQGGGGPRLGWAMGVLETPLIAVLMWESDGLLSYAVVAKSGVVLKVKRALGGGEVISLVPGEGDLIVSPMAT